MSMSMSKDMHDVIGEYVILYTIRGTRLVRKNAGELPLKVNCYSDIVIIMIK